MAVILQGISYIDQSGVYPTGCESVSAVMLLNYLGIPVTADEFIQKYLDKQGFEEREDGLYGPDPNKYFCGSPYDEDSFGCYAPVITEALNRVFQEWSGPEHKADHTPGEKQICGFEARNETGAQLEELCGKYIDKGMPVLCWSCIEMREPVIGPEWKLYDTGEVFTWISNEHCMLLAGYDEEGYWFYDPYGNRGLIHHPKELAQDRYCAQHMQAVGILREL